MERPAERPAEVRHVTLRHTMGAELLPILEDLCSSICCPPTPSGWKCERFRDWTAVRDERTNTLILRGPRPRLEELIELIARLDDEAGHGAQQAQSAIDRREPVDR